MTVKRLTQEEFNDRFDYLLWTAPVDLAETDAMAEKSDDNPAKVVETLRLISKTARECALHLEDQERERTRVGPIGGVE